MKRFFVTASVSSWAAAAVVLAAACTSSQPAPKVENATPPPPASTMTPPPPLAPADAFAALSKRFLAEYLRRDPVAATQAGDHTNDASWPAFGEAAEKETLAFLDSIERDLAAIPASSLDVEAAIDRAVLANVVAYWRFAIVELKSEVTDPLSYARVLGDGLDPLLTRDFAPAGERAKSLRGRLEGIPVITQSAKTRLAHPPRVHTETAIQQIKGLVDLCDHDVKDFAAKAGGDQAALLAAAKTAGDALRDFATWLEKDLLPRADGDFRIGRAKLEKKIRFELGDQVDIDALRATAQRELERAQDSMADVAIDLSVKLFPKEKLVLPKGRDQKKALVRRVLAELAKDHPSNATIVGDAKKLLADATAFVKTKDLVSVPDEPCRVIEMPEYRRGVAIAYCDSSGPLEPKQETFFAIAPTPKDWPPARVDSFYREYDASMLADLTVHEAMPGHFLQLMHNNRFPSKLRAVFSNGAFVEGWAVYAEWLMADQGFGGPAVKLQRLKMLARVAANAILDHDIHAGEMSEKDALALMENEAFQEEGEAVGKWKRARLTSAQLSTYFYGFSRMMEARERGGAKAKADGKPFSERAFHDGLLAHGSPPMPLALVAAGLAPRGDHD